MALSRSLAALLMTSGALWLAGCATGGTDESATPSPRSPEAQGLTARTNEAALPARYTNGLWYMVKGGEVAFIPGERCQVAGVFVADCPEAAQIMDLGGAYITPGFGEAHNHSVDGPWTLGTAQSYLGQGIYYYKNPNNVGPLAGITFWDCAHEGSAGMMADGYTRATGEMSMMIAQNG
ncbi:MAG: thiamine pyrophosphate-binding protein, partial [Pseudomonadota bacterium]